MNQASSSDNPGVSRTISSPNSDDKKEVIAIGSDLLDPKGHQAVLSQMATVLSGLTPEDKQTVLNQASIRSPGQKASDRLWLIIVLSFAIVLVGTFLSLAFGVLVLSKSAADAELQILLTMFTSAVAFLAGLLTPGPTRSQASNQ